MNHNLVAALIVRNEVPVLGRCLESLRPWVDAIVISDTGSTDGTTDLALDFGAKVREDPWVDFSTNRNHVLAEAARTYQRYVLCGIDADETLVVPDGYEWPEFNAAGYYLNVHNGDLRYKRMAIVSPHLDWKWQGVLHEALMPPLSFNAVHDTPTIEGPYIFVRHDGCRSRDPDTQLKDLALLQAAVAKNPSNARYQFYMAQTMKDLKMFAPAREAYEKRANMRGWAPETSYAKYMTGVMTQWLGENPVSIYLEAYNWDNTRAEFLVAAATYLRTHGNPSAAAAIASTITAMDPPTHACFIEQDVYDWRALDEFVMTAFYVPHLKSLGAIAATELLSRPFPETERARIEKNCAFYTKG